jgi:hypothetical protein
MVASKKLVGGDLASNCGVLGWLCSKVKVSRGSKPSPHNGLEPAPLTSEIHRFTAQEGIFARQP